MVRDDCHVFSSFGMICRRAAGDTKGGGACYNGAANRQISSGVVISSLLFSRAANVRVPLRQGGGD